MGPRPLESACLQGILWYTWRRRLFTMWLPSAYRPATIRILASHYITVKVTITL